MVLYFITYLCICVSFDGYMYYLFMEDACTFAVMYLCIQGRTAFVLPAAAPVTLESNRIFLFSLSNLKRFSENVLRFDRIAA